MRSITWLISACCRPNFERLFPQLPVGTPVNIVNQPVKAGWRRRQTVHREVHPPLEEYPNDRGSMVEEVMLALDDAMARRSVATHLDNVLLTHNSTTRRAFRAVISTGEVIPGSTVGRFWRLMLELDSGRSAWDEVKFTE
ncbi:MAG: hypothetical protein IPG06_22325 [Haliea sp.]|nr:hypothetical protein [Haliea sp.]